MFHADLAAHVQDSRRAPAVERRAHERLECDGAEVVIAWNHALHQRVRMRLINLGEGGMQVGSTLPLVPDTTGIAISILPEGVALNRVFSVIWVREFNGGFRAGLHFLS